MNTTPINTTQEFQSYVRKIAELERAADEKLQAEEECTPAYHKWANIRAALREAIEAAK